MTWSTGWCNPEAVCFANNSLQQTTIIDRVVGSKVEESENTWIPSFEGRGVLFIVLVVGYMHVDEPVL